MKLLAILCVVGFAAASSQSGGLFKPGHTYTFKYEGRMLTGLPQLAPHYSGLGIRCQVHVQVQGEDKYGIRITDGTFVKVNEELQAEGTDSSRNWRNINLPESFQPIPNDAAKYLSEPTILKLKYGKFESLTVSKDEPEWTINFKKGLAVLFNAQTHEIDSAISGNMLQLEDIKTGEDSPMLWKTEEESLEGLCEVTYQINQLPLYMIRENKFLSPLTRTCAPSGRITDTKYYEIVRSRDVNTCNRHNGGTYSYYKPGHIKCDAGNCPSHFSRSSVTRYIACGNSKDELNIQAIYNEGETEFDLLSANTEKFVTGDRQNLTLIDMRSSSTSGLSKPTNPVEKTTLKYEVKQEVSKLPSVVSKITGKKIPEGSEALKVNAIKGDWNFDPEKIVEELFNLMKDVVERDLLETTSNPDKELPLKMLNLARGFSLLHDKSYVEKVYNKLCSSINDPEHRHTMDNIFFDTLLMGGTRVGIEFIKDKIQSGQIGDFQAATIFTTMPNYLLVPTEEVLESIFDLIQSGSLRQQRSEMVYHQAILGFSTLVHKACVTPERQQSYPVSTYGQMCHPEAKIVVDRLIPYLKQQLESTTSSSSTTDAKNLYLIALGIVAHENTLPILLPYLQGDYSSSSPSGLSGSEEEMKFNRYLAIFSVRNVGIRYPGMVEPILYSVLSNPAELTETRVAAFRSILSLNPSESYLNRIASLTWRIKDQELLKVIDTAFWSLASRSLNEPLRNSFTSLSRKAFVIYPLIKKVGGNQVFSSAAFYDEDFLPHLNTAYHSMTAWTSAEQGGQQYQDSYVPTDFYHRLSLLFNRYQITVFEGGYRLVGAEDLIQKTVEMLTPNMQHHGRSYYEEKIIQRDLGHEWKEVIDKLGLRIKDHEGRQGMASFYLNIMENAPLFKALRSQSPQSLKQDLEKLIKKDPTTLKDKICGEHKVNLQRAMNMHTAVLEVPNDMGFPFFMETHVPTLFSLRGRMNIDCNSGKFIPKFQVEGKHLFEGSFTGFIGTIIPFTKEFITTGVQQTAMLNLPTKFDITGDSEQQLLKLKVHTLNKFVGSNPIDVVHYEGKPFTVAKDLFDLKPFSRCSQFKVVRSPSVRKEKEYPFGQDILGLDFQTAIKTESRFLDFRSIFEKLKLYNYNPINLLRFGPASTALSEHQRPSVRFHQYRLAFNPSSSQTREIDLQVKWGAATKLQGESVKYHMLKIKSQEKETLESFPEWKKLLPIKWVSKKIDEVSEHQQRRLRLKEVMEKTGLKTGQALVLNFRLGLTGGRPRTLDFTFKHAVGEEHYLKQKWHMSLESAHTDKKVCFDGILDLPDVPVWKLSQIRSSSPEFALQSRLGYGRQCQESKVVVIGTGRVSEKQKEFSRYSKESKLYQDLKERRVPLSSMSSLLEEVRRQASIFDEIDIKERYENVGPIVGRFAKYFSEYTKSFLWPYLVVSDTTGSSSVSSLANFENKWRLRYDSTANTVDITLTKPDEVVQFNHVRLPDFITTFYPPSAVKMLKKGLSGLSSKAPVCKLEGRWIKNLRNITVETKVDDCFHLVAGDCSYKKSFSILARNVTMGRDSAKEVKILIGKTVIKLTGSSSSSSVKVKVNSTDVSIGSGHFLVKDDKKDYVADIYLFKDGVVRVQTLYCPILRKPSVDVTFDGFKLETKLSPMWSKDRMCGLCSGMTGPEKCVFSKPEILTASYRVSTSSKSCSVPSAKIQQELQREKSECLKIKSVPTSDLLKSFEAQVGPCTRHTHQIVEEVDKFCFSRVPVISCSPLCKASQYVTKGVSFGCLDKSRVAERYAEKIRRGEILEELKGLSESFNTVLTVPQSCNKV